MYSWRRVATVVFLAATSTLTGLRRQARCSFATLLVIVAEKSCVRRSCVGCVCVCVRRRAVRALGFSLLSPRAGNQCT